MIKMNRVYFYAVGRSNVKLYGGSSLIPGGTGLEV